MRKNGQIYCESCYRKYKKNTDFKYDVVTKIRKRLSTALHRFTKTGKLPCKSKTYQIDFTGIIKHLGPCPGNRKDYHIDHIVPLASFDFNDPEQIKLAFAPENHQWLTKEENLKKGSKLNWSRKNADM